MRRVLIAGYFGFGNAGDEAILAGMLTSLRQEVPDLAATVVSKDPDETRYLHGVEAVHWQDVTALLAATETADLVIVGGGGLFQDHWGVKPETYLTPAHGDITFYGVFPLLANLCGKPCMTYAVGIGPIKTLEGETHTTLALKQCDTVTVRDSQSLRVAERAGNAIQVSDPAFALVPASPQAAMTAAGAFFDWSRRPLLGVSVRHWAASTHADSLFDRLALTLDLFLQKTDGQVLFLPFQSSKIGNPLEDDAGACQEVMRRMKRAAHVETALNALRPEVLAALVGRCDAVLGMRFHAALLAFAQGVPAAGIAYDPKVSRLFSEAGLEDLCTETDSLNPEFLAATLAGLVSEPAPVRQSVESFAQRQRPLAGLPASLARELLDRGPRASAPRQRGLVDFVHALIPHWSKLNADRTRLEAAVQSASALASRQSEELARLSGEVSKRDSVIASRDSEIDRLHEELAWRRDVLAARDEALRDAQERYAVAAGQVASLAQHLACAEADRTALLSRTQELQEELSRIYGSSGWKALVRLWDLKRLLTGKSRTGDSVVPAPERTDQDAPPPLLQDVPQPLPPVTETSPTVRPDSGPPPSSPVLEATEPPPPAPVSTTGAEPVVESLPSATRNPFDVQLDLILGRADGKSPVVVFPPSVSWEIPLFQRPQQMALAFARLGCLVFYCDYQSPLGPGFHEVRPGLFRCDVPIETFRALSRVLLIVLSYNRHWIAHFTDPLVIYEYIDELDVFSVDDKVQLKRDHDRLLTEADLVVATAQQLLEGVRPARPDALLCPNGVDYSHFAAAQGITTTPPPPDMGPFLQKGTRESGLHGLPLLRPQRPIIGYYGALARWVDYPMLRRVALLRPGWTFLLIGPPHDSAFEQSGIGAEPNIHWLGQKSYQDLPLYLRHFDVATIPFIVGPITHATSPLKLFEYMAGGKIVVTTPMEESMRFEGVLTASGPAAFVERLEDALTLREDPACRSRIDRVARENTWEQRARSILEALGTTVREV
ncbi:MAG: polysaccharide pyruvyl transferase family protein [Thermoanaerobaculia bacterium]|nr:polysaccharide pyruvyl transferase family protein [Thermoanaerobaculia bacterium]